MYTGHKKERPRNLTVYAAAATMLAAALTVFPGCASRGAIPVVRKIQSMTPCAMMMKSMMEHEQVGREREGGMHTQENDMESAAGSLP